VNADELDAAREAVAASKAWRDQMRADWGYHREPEEILDETVGELIAERDRLRAVVDATRAYLDEVPAILRDDVSAREDSRLGDLIAAVGQLDVSPTGEDT
jgi:hypothetical protein